ncbi:hypothetical protein [Micromonospora aurantiaca]|uniref:hypothetical protein n=1 Tax=Micromonospora aurantiaca (nom. illeg.) TaxID=47850 RepID=UPI002E16BB4B
MRMSHAGQLRVSIAALLIGGLFGCSASPPADRGGGTAAGSSDQHLTEKERADGAAAQEALLGDGVISRADYEKATEFLSKCLQAHDVQLVNKGWNPVNQQVMTMWYRNPELSDDEVGAIGDECHGAWLGRVEDQFAKSNPPRMKPELMLVVKECLRNQNLAVSDRAVGIPDLDAELGEDRRQDIRACVRQAVSQLYPDSPVAIY